MGEGDSKDVFSRIFLHLKLLSRIVVQQDNTIGNTEQLVCKVSELLAMTLPAPYKYRHDKILAGCGTKSVSFQPNASISATISKLANAPHTSLSDVTHCVFVWYWSPVSCL